MMSPDMHTFLQEVLRQADPSEISYILDPIDMTITTCTKVTDAQMRQASDLLGLITIKEPV